MAIQFPIHTHLNDGSPVRLSVAGPDEIEPLFRLFQIIVEEASSFPHEQIPSDEEFRAFWFGGCSTVVASSSDHTDRSEIAGAYYLKANWPGRASHVANAGFVVAPQWRRKGLARLLAATMLEHARSLGFQSVIFTLVFEENLVAHRLWKQLGFDDIAVVPKAVRKKDGTFQNAYIMFRSLVE